MKLEELKDRAVSPPFPPVTGGASLRDDGAIGVAPTSELPPPGPIPGQMTVEEALALPEGAAVTEEFVTEKTPSGLEIYYSWAPKRLYRLMALDDSWIEVPSVTNVLGVLDKSGALTWWGMKVGVEGVLKLGDDFGLWPRVCESTVDQLVELLTEHKLTVNHVKNAAADRGVNVHGALEHWCETGKIPDPDLFKEHEQGYIVGLVHFLTDIQRSVNRDAIRAELMVGSLEHLYAGRFDLDLLLEEPCELVTRCYPKRADKIETIPGGLYRNDAKTSKRVYDSHALQLEAYEGAAIECGYPASDYRAVIHLMEDGRYEFVVSEGWTFGDFLTIRKCYAVMSERDKLKNEREVEAELRLMGATDVE